MITASEARQKLIKQKEDNYFKYKDEIKKHLNHISDQIVWKSDMFLDSLDYVNDLRNRVLVELIVDELERFGYKVYYRPSDYDTNEYYTITIRW
jgi:hypothetical protein